jgi:hypothetical protein
MTDGEGSMVATGGFRSRVRVASLTAAIALALAGAGCSGGTDDRLPPAPTPTPTASPTPTLDPEDAAAFAVLEGYLRTLVSAMTESGASEDLTEYATSTQVELVNGVVQANRREGRTYTGGIYVKSMDVVERHLDATEPIIVVEACLDGGDWRLVDRETGGLIGVDPTEHETTHVGLFELQPDDDAGWLVSAPRLLPQWYIGVPEKDLEPC